MILERSQKCNVCAHWSPTDKWLWRTLIYRTDW